MSDNKQNKVFGEEPTEDSIQILAQLMLWMYEKSKIKNLSLKKLFFFSKIFWRQKEYLENLEIIQK